MRGKYLYIYIFIIILNLVLSLRVFGGIKVTDKYQLNDILSIGRYSNNLGTAITSIGSSHRVLRVDTGITLAADANIPTNIVLEITKNGSITLGNYDLKIHKFKTGPYRCFIENGTGAVTFRDRAVDYVLSEWWYSGSGCHRTAINSACASLSSGGKLKFLTGNYDVDLDNGSLTPVSDLVIEGVGKESRIVFSGSRYSVLATYKYGWNLTNQTNVTFRELAMDGNSTTQAEDPVDPDGAYTIIRFTPASNDAVCDIIIENCYFTDSWSEAIGSYGYGAHAYPHPTTKNIKIRNCIFEGTGTHGVSMSEWTDSVVEGCYFKNVGINAMIAGDGSGMGVDVSGGCKDIIITNNVVEGAGAGFKAEAHSKTATTLDANEVADQTTLSVTATTDMEVGNTAGIVLNDTSVFWSDIVSLVTNDTITIAEGLPSAADGNNVVSIITRAKNVIIADNQISDLTEGADYSVWYGIRVNGENIIVRNNVITSYSHGIDGSDKAKNCIIANNIIKSTTHSLAQGIRIADGHGGHVIEGNRVSLTQSRGIACADENSIIRGNIVTKCGEESAVGGIAVFDADNVIINGNVCIDNFGSGIAVSKVIGTTSDILVNDNICIDTRSGGDRTQTYGIWVNPTDTARVISVGNRCYNNSTLDIPTYNYFDLNHDNAALRVGNEAMITITEDDSQDIIEFGDDGDIDIKLSGGADGALTIQGSDAYVGIGTITPMAKAHIKGSGDNTTGILYINSSSAGEDGSLIKLGTYNYLSQINAGSIFLCWGASWDGDNNEWDRREVDPSYLPYLSISTGNNITMGGADSSDPNDTNPTMAPLVQFEMDTGYVGFGTTTPTAAVDIDSEILRLRGSKTPSAANDTGAAGSICWDASYIYVCVGTDEWERAAIASW